MDGRIARTRQGGRNEVEMKRRTGDPDLYSVERDVRHLKRIIFILFITIAFMQLNTYLMQRQIEQIYDFHSGVVNWMEQAVDILEMLTEIVSE